MTMAARIGVIQDGRLLQLGTPREIYETPNDIYVATRLGMPEINLLPAELLAEARAPRHAKTVGVRTEHLPIPKPNGGHPRGRVHRNGHPRDQNHTQLDYNRPTPRPPGATP